MDQLVLVDASPELDERTRVDLGAKTTGRRDAGVDGQAEKLVRDAARLVRDLVDIAMTRDIAAGRSPSEPREDAHVLLDLEIDGVRCILLRRNEPTAMDLLSPREREIARMASLGYPNKAIASVLEISSWTVSSHLRRIFVKLGVSSRAAMATRLSGRSVEVKPPAEPVL